MTRFATRSSFWVLSRILLPGLLGICVPAFVPAQNTDARLAQAAGLYRDGKAGEAEGLLRELAKSAPQNAAVWNLLGAVLDARKDYDGAETCFRKAIELAPQSAGILNNLGNHYVAAGKPEQALAVFRKVLAVEPAHQNANLQLARLLVDRKQGKEALDHLARLKTAAPGSLAVELLRARALFEAGRGEEARALMARLETTAEGPAAWYSIGRTLVDIEEYARAEEALSRALEANPADPDVLHDLGVAALRAKHSERAQQVFEAMLRTRLDDPEALFQLGRSIGQQGRHEDALPPLARARKLAPERADVLYMLATTAAQAGFFGDAALAFSDYLKLRPQDETARRERGFAYFCAGNHADGLRDLEWYIGRHPNDPDGQFELGFGLTTTGPDKALRHLNEAIRLKPDFPEARLVRGALYQRQGSLALALPDLEYAASRRPDHIRAIALLGRAYLDLERPQDAIRVLRRGYEKAPKDSQILMTLGRALYDNGEREEGSRLLQEFAKVGPDRTGRRSAPGTLTPLYLSPEEFNARYEANLRSALSSRSGDPEVREKLARLLLANNRKDEALAQYRDILASGAKPQVLVASGQVLIDAGEYALAKEFLERALASEPDTTARLDYVIALLGNREPEAALHELERVPEKDRQGDFYLLRARVLDALGNAKEALESLDAGVRRSPTRSDLYENASSFLLKHGRDAEALALLEKATATVPNDPNLLLAKATVLGIQNRTPDALALLRRITARWPEMSRPYVVRGIIEENHSDSSEALKSIEIAMAMGERSPEAYYYVAQARYHVEPEKPQAAFDAIRKALQLDPTDPWAQALAGRLAWELHDYAASERYLQEAIRLKKDFVKAHFWLGATYRSMGRDRQAEAELAEVGRIHETNPKAESEEGPLVRDRLFPAPR